MNTRDGLAVGTALCLFLCFGARVDAAPVNVARSGTASQSSLGSGGVPTRAIDGNRSGHFFLDSSVTHTSSGDPDPDPQLFEWWEVKLDNSYLINQIVLFNRTDCCSARLIPCRVSLYSGTVVSFTRDVTAFEADISESWISGMTINVNGEAGDRVRVQLMHRDFLSLAEVEVYGVEASCRVVQVSPGPGASQVAPRSTVGVRFSGPMEYATVNETTWTVTGSMSQAASGEIRWVRPDSATFFPRSRFRDGEEVTVVLSGAIADSSGRYLDGNVDGQGGDDYVWRFAIAEIPVIAVPALAPFPPNRYVVMSLPVLPLPGSRLSSVLSDLDPPGAYSWRGFGVVNGTYVPDPVMQPGQAFILCTTQAVVPIFHGTAPDDSIAVNLSLGWNLVGCVGCGTGVYPWSACTVINGDAERSFHDQPYVTPAVLWYADDTGDLRNNGLWDWRYGTDLFSTPPAPANPWDGYLMYARAPCILVFRKQTVSAAVTTGPSDGAAVRGAAAGDWSIRLYAEADGTRDGWLELGVQSEAASGPGDLDLFRPPAFSDGVRLSITHDDAGRGPPESYLADFRGAGEDSYTWDLTLGYAGTRNDDETARLIWRDLTGVPEEWHVYLVTGESRAIDMRAADHYDLLLEAAEPRRLSVRASRETWPGELITPGSNRIVALSPSPSVADVSVDLRIGVAGMVDLSVFDVQGRAVDRLFSGPLEVGRYERTWSPAASGVVSGVYFVKLRTPAGEDTRRVVVIRG